MANFGRLQFGSMARSRPNGWAARLPVERPSVPSHPHSGMGVKRLNYKRPTRQFDPDDKAALWNEREGSPRSFCRLNHASAVCVVRLDRRCRAGLTRGFLTQSLAVLLWGGGVGKLGSRNARDSREVQVLASHGVTVPHDAATRAGRR